uniref:GH18 domain-containing protein n=1 Tax=Oryza barthii TaxID=65489 RepID=A0A0D3G504_9ORYZ
MAPRRLAALAPLAVLLLLSSCLAAAPATAQQSSSIGDTVVFWGRNKAEGSLREACDTGLYNTVIISFLSAFGRGSYKLDLSGHPVVPVGGDIKYCQSKGKTVLLAIGGFIDQGATEHYDELARLLHSHSNGGVMLTATARCVFPDQRLQAALATGLFSRIHVKLFNDGRCTWGRRESLEKWAAAYPDSRIFVGIVASPEADRDAYMSHKDLYFDVLQFINKLPNYGGIMVWNRYWDKKTGYINGDVF